MVLNVIKPPQEVDKCCRYDCKHAEQKPDEYPCYFCTANQHGNPYYKQFRYESKEVKQNDD